MLYYNQFESFNPMLEDVLCPPFSYLPKIAWRARSLLNNRSIEQITSMAKRISEEIRRYYSDEKSNAIWDLESKFRNGELSNEEFERFFDWDGGSIHNGRWIFKDGMEDELDIPTENDDSEVDALKAIIETRDSNFFTTKNIIEPEPNEYPEGKDYEMFAVMALWFIADAIKSINHGGKHGQSIAGDYLIESMDAVSYAEHLREKEWLIFYSKKVGEKALIEVLQKQKEELGEWKKQNKEQLTKKLSEQGKKGADKKHERTNKAKQELIGIWATGRYKSRDECAEQECSHLNISLSTARKALINTPEPVR